jgi:hypothetical protein
MAPGIALGKGREGGQTSQTTLIHNHSWMVELIRAMCMNFGRNEESEYFSW